MSPESSSSESTSGVTRRGVFGSAVSAAGLDRGQHSGSTEGVRRLETKEPLQRCGRVLGVVGHSPYRSLSRLAI